MRETYALYFSRENKRHLVEIKIGLIFKMKTANFFAKKYEIIEFLSNIVVCTN